MRIELAQKRVKDFERKYKEVALRLAYHAALPVALNADLLHLLRINFFLDPPDCLSYTAEFELLLSPLCTEIDEGLYEIEPEIRDILLQGLYSIDNGQRLKEVATLLWQYIERDSIWKDREELQRAQQLTVLNFLDPSMAAVWLAELDSEIGANNFLSRDWYVAMRQEIDFQLISKIRQLVEDKLSDDDLSKLCQDDFPKVYEQFATEQNKSQRVQLLIEYAQRHSGIKNLLNEIELFILNIDEENINLLNKSSYKYAYYISYQSGGGLAEENLIYQVAQKLKSDLEKELSLYFEVNERGVYLDRIKLNGENIFDIQVLRQSMRMICILTPNYFSENYSICAKEYRAMEIRETALAKLFPELLSQELKLIVPMILRTKAAIPKAFQQRECIDITGFSIENGKLINPNSYQNICRHLAEGAYELSEIFKQHKFAYKYDIFISYSSKDLAWVNNILLAKLESQELKVCIDFRDFIPGMSIIENIKRSFLSSKKTLLVMSPNYLDSSWTEIDILLQPLSSDEGQLKIILLMYQKCRLPLPLASVTYLDFTDLEDENGVWDRLINTIKYSAS
jgi:hypothetical protein